jgi:hypothetical protein
MKYLIFIIIFTFFTNISAQTTVQAKIKKNSSSENCVDIYAKSNTSIDAPPSNYVMSVSIPVQTNNPSVSVSNLLSGMILDINNPSPYTANGRRQYDLNIVQDGNPPNISWSANSDYLIATVCFENGDDPNSTVQINDKSTGGNNDFTYWYFGLQGPGDVTNYSAKFYDDGGSTSNAHNGTDSYAETTEKITLPLDLMNFLVENYKETSSYLSWSCLSNIDINRFEIERSPDSRTWKCIGKVNPFAFQRSNDYSYIDKNVYNGDGEKTFYYRLKTIDINGMFAYSEIRSVIFNSKNIELTLFPNPSSEKVYFSLNGITQKQYFNITIFDTSGKLVFNKNMEYKNKTTLLMDNTITGLKSGIYNVIIKDDNNNRRFYKKLLLAK